jgi:hypothetical protein
LPIGDAHAAEPDSDTALCGRYAMCRVEEMTWATTGFQRCPICEHRAAERQARPRD